MGADRTITTIAKSQRGAFTRDQAHAAGLTDHQLRTRMRAGRLERVGPNAFRLPGTDSSPMSRLLGLMLDIGARCWASGPTAAALYRLDGFELVEPFHVVIDHGRNVRRIGHMVHTSSYLPEGDHGVVGGLDVTKPTRTLLDLGRTVDRPELTVALDSAVRDRLCSEATLLRRIATMDDRVRHLMAVDDLLAVIEGSEIERGGHSFLEREFLHLLARADLPRPDAQQVVGEAGSRLVRVDFRFPRTNVVVEVLGYRYHRTPAQLSRDAERLNEMISRGLRPFQFAYDHVVSQEQLVVDTLRPALAQRVER